MFLTRFFFILNSKNFLYNKFYANNGVVKIFSHITPIESDGLRSQKISS